MKVYNLFFIILIESFIFLACAQSADNGFKIIKESHNKIYLEDINTEIYKGSTMDKFGNKLNLYGIEFKERGKLASLEKSIFQPEERKQIQGYGRRAALAFFTVEAVSGNIVCVSFTFRNIDESFSINMKKLARYREEIKKNIKYHYLSFEGGGSPVSGYFHQIMPVFID